MCLCAVRACSWALWIGLHVCVHVSVRMHVHVSVLMHACVGIGVHAAGRVA